MRKISKLAAFVAGAAVLLVLTPASTILDVLLVAMIIFLDGTFSN